MTILHIEVLHTIVFGMAVRVRLHADHDPSARTMKRWKEETLR